MEGASSRASAAMSAAARCQSAILHLAFHLDTGWTDFSQVGSVANSAGKVEGPETQEAKESVNGSRAEVGPDVASKLSSLFAGLPSLAGPQRLATTLRQRFANNSGYPRPGLMRAAPIATIPSSRHLRLLPRSHQVIAISSSC
ncbi:hypothetical protein K0M31_010308 [Melipona bicolor]|uniref:Uncharacterized protein n=1 Tax=Melipona bicolor TaxID=60889 RepID=A0AA40FLR7_9HYME|nr:hypothetical protein K0M31_010308 [Melipona bicolor]